jgi:Zn-dependent protease with chaperone function
MPQPLRRVLRSLLGIALLCCLAQWASAEIVRDLPPGVQIPAAALPGPNFDVDKATDGYLNLLTPEQQKLSDEYFEGGYWLQLWGLLWTVAICVVLLVTGIARRMSQWSQRVSRRRWVSTLVCLLMFFVVFFLLALPFDIYTDFIRDGQYGLTQQSFGGFMRDQMIGLVANSILTAVAVTVIYAFVRRTGTQWWAWATAFTWVFLLFVQLIAPVYLFPLLNDYKPLPEGPVREAVLSLARANQVPTAHVEWFDASKQTTRVSANVAGLLGTTRIALNDNLVNKTSLPEIKAVLGHEMGHYVLNHVWKAPILLALVIGLAMLLLALSLDRTLARWGARFQVTNRADAAGLPIALGLFMVILFLLTPLQNLVVRSYESEADAFGLNASREPYGWATSAMRLSTYRKLSPGPVEEFLFYDHPSGYERVHRAMIWLKENQQAVGAIEPPPAGVGGSVPPVRLNR